jgi:hypothetical protein
VGYFVLRVDVAYGGFEVIPSPGLRQGISCKGESVPCRSCCVIDCVFDEFRIDHPLMAMAQRFYICYVAGEVTSGTLKARHVLASMERHACCCGHHVGDCWHVAGRVVKVEHSNCVWKPRGMLE